MPDPLQTIVQRMIDAGESEENIGAVIQHVKQSSQAGPSDTLQDTPGMFGSAGRRELMRTATEAGIGLARSPIDAVKGLFGLVRHPIDSVVNTGRALAHPIDTINYIGDNPREGGSLIGQLLLGKLVPENAGALTRGAGRAVSAVGRGAETVGTSAPARYAGRFGAIESALRLDPKGLAIAAAPAALEYGGKGLQRLGGAIERTPASMDSLMGRTSPDASLDAAAAAAADRARGIRRGTPEPRTSGFDVSEGMPSSRSGVTTPPPGEYSTRGIGIEDGRLRMPEPADPGFGDVRDVLSQSDTLDEVRRVAHRYEEMGMSPAQAAQRAGLELRRSSPALDSLQRGR